MLIVELILEPWANLPQQNLNLDFAKNKVIYLKRQETYLPAYMRSPLLDLVLILNEIEVDLREGDGTATCPPSNTPTSII